MYRKIRVPALMALSLAGAPLAAQLPDAPAPPSAELHTQKLSGPRFGFTVFTGDVATMRNQADLEPIITQFGWQFETAISSGNGGQALMEWVALVGGIEQEELNMSLAWLTGYRLASGLEFGVGPNVSINPDSERPSTSMIVAAGATLPFGEIHVPLNFAVGVARGGPRVTVLMGWIL